MYLSNGYFNPLRPSHVEFLNGLNGQLEGYPGKLKTISMGNGIQVVFANDRYLMTVDWKKI